MYTAMIDSIPRGSMIHPPFNISSIRLMLCSTTSSPSTSVAAPWAAACISIKGFIIDVSFVGYKIYCAKIRKNKQQKEVSKYYSENIPPPRNLNLNRDLSMDFSPLRHTGKGGRLLRRELALPVLEPARDGNHCRIVGRQRQIGNVGPPTPAPLHILHGSAQSAVGRHPAGQRYFLNAGLLSRLYQLIHQHLHNGPLQRSAQIVAALHHKIRIFLQPVAQKIQKRSL